MSDWDVVRQLGGWPWPFDAEMTMGRCRPFSGLGFVWGMFTEQGLIGTIGVTDHSLGYCLMKTHWGQGLASEAARYAIDHAFDQYNSREIEATVWRDNVNSRRVLEKLGFQKSGEGAEHALARDELTEFDAYTLSKGDWMARNHLRCEPYSSTRNTNTVSKVST